MYILRRAQDALVAPGGKYKGFRSPVPGTGDEDQICISYYVTLSHPQMQKSHLPFMCVCNPGLIFNESSRAFPSHLPPSSGSKHRAQPPSEHVLLPFQHILWKFEQFWDVSLNRHHLFFFTRIIYVFDLTLLFLFFLTVSLSCESYSWPTRAYLSFFPELSKACFPKSRTRVSSAWWSLSSVWPGMTQSFFLEVPGNYTIAVKFFFVRFKSRIEVPLLFPLSSWWWGH